MGRICLVMVVGCIGLSIAQASDSGAHQSVCEAPRDCSDPAAKTLTLEEPPEDVVCRDDTTGDLAGIESPLNLEALRGIESAFPDFRRSKGIDLSESVVRVYDADGNQYEERKIRFGALPRSLMLNLQRRAEKAEASSAIEGVPEPLQYTPDFCKPLTDPLLYAPILVDPGLKQPIPCQY